MSVGVQALNDNDLRALGRLHSAAEAQSAVEMAMSVFPRVSFDLIYARQNQSLEDWRAELTFALEMGANHLSLYQLTVEDGTVFGERFARGGLRGLPDEDLAADMYELTQSLTEQAGLPAYEVSNHATPGAESAHNQIYWKSHDWAGVGPGAHGRMTIDGKRLATEAHAMPTTWLSAVDGGSGDFVHSDLSGTDVFDEYLMMGLRLREGVRLEKEEISNRIMGLVNSGFLSYTDRTLKTTDRGRPVLNAILRDILI